VIDVTRRWSLPKAGTGSHSELTTPLINGNMQIAEVQRATRRPTLEEDVWQHVKIQVGFICHAYKLIHYHGRGKALCSHVAFQFPDRT
jgi:hypothetical protein